ncbi:MAG: hypothetical protein D3922_09690, partial [Candidatus Electrothrix sp. AR1]|nr:hypothetical protein [Candidatus Electrothrix sp. AR1]
NHQRYIWLHDWKVYCSLAVYVFLISAVSWSLHHLDTESLYDSSQAHYAKVVLEVLEEKIQQEPESSRWFKWFGDLMVKNGKELAALQAYEKAVASPPVSPELANNMARLLLTAKDHSLRDPVRALALARSAARFSEQGLFWIPWPPPYGLTAGCRRLLPLQGKLLRLMGRALPIIRREWINFDGNPGGKSSDFSPNRIKKQRL